MLVLQPKLDEKIVFRGADVEIKIEFLIKKQHLIMGITVPDSVDVTREKIEGSVDKRIIRGHHLYEGK
jgi:sRNA-binding carbon storage regulator CsrA